MSFFNDEYELVDYECPKKEHKWSIDGFGDWTLTIEITPSTVARWFKAKTRQAKYIGSCTIWHRVIDDNLIRTSSSMESLLYDFLQTAEYREKKKKDV
jgi:hypothetical protein